MGRGELAERLVITGKEVWQRRPYTHVALSAVYGDMEFFGHGFSKCCWPDEWSAEKGAKYARKKAMSDIYRQVRGE